MKTVLFPTVLNDACCADYDIALRADRREHVDIVVLHSPRTGIVPSLWNGDWARDVVLNKILANDLFGIPIAALRFFVLIDAGEEGGFHGAQHPIELDADDFCVKGNPCDVSRVPVGSQYGRWLYCLGYHRKAFTYWPRDVVGGCANFYTDFEDRRMLGRQEILSLAAAIGYRPETKSLPPWLTNLFDEEMRLQ